MKDIIPELTLVIPAYNEETLISGTLNTLIPYLDSHFSSYEIVVVDDGSSDHTPQIVTAAGKGRPAEGQIRLVRNDQNRGKGFSIQRGMLEAKGRMLIFTDADMPYALEGIEHIVKALTGGYSLAIGSRSLQGSEKREVPVLRYIAGQAFSLLVQALVFPGIHDTQCGLKGFTAEAAQDVFRRLTIGGFGFDVEVLYLARKMGYSILPIPVKMTGHRYDSRVNVLRDSGRMFLDLFVIRWNDWRGKYNLQKD